MKKSYAIGAIILAIIIVLVLTLGRSKKANAPESSTENKTSQTNSQSSSSNALTNNVSITTGMVFSPATVSVSVGTTVTWTNNDSMAHTITADDGSFDSGSISTNGTFKHKFDKAGTFKYHCNFHSSMTGTVEVK